MRDNGVHNSHPRPHYSVQCIASYTRPSYMHYTWELLSLWLQRPLKKGPSAWPYQDCLISVVSWQAAH
jgi:hypothetical protein